MLSKNNIKQTANNCINIQIINKCQLNCPGCRGSILRNDLNRLSANTLMSTDEFIKIVNKCVTEGFTQFHLVPTIGDPFLDTTIFEKLTYLESIPEVDNYLVTTNLLALNSYKINSLLQYKKLILDISVYGYDKPSYIENTGTDTFNLFYKNFKKLYGCVSYNNKYDYEIQLTMRCNIPYDSNFPKTPLVYTINNFLSLRGVTIDNDNILNVNRGGSIPPGNLTNEPETIKRQGICPALKDLAGGILPGGDVIFCPCHDMYRTGVVGNFFKNTIKQIRSSGKFQQIRKDHSQNIYTGICRDCNDYT